MDYNRLTLIVAILTLAVAAVTLWYTVPQTKLNLFFDTTHNTDRFIVSNLGNKPINNVKVSYSLDCQKINYTPRYISKEVPILTESNGPQPFYVHYLDNTTSTLIENAKSNPAVCERIENQQIFIPYSEFRLINKSLYDQLEHVDTTVTFSKLGVSSYTKYFCDSCKLHIEAETDSSKKELDYSFINPIQVDVNITCYWTFTGYDYVVCPNAITQVKPVLVEPINFTIAFNTDNREGVIIWFPSAEVRKEFIKT